MLVHVLPADAGTRPEYAALIAAGAEPGETIVLGSRGIPMRVVDLPALPEITSLFHANGRPTRRHASGR
jgi:hypothetical protein